MNFTKEQIDVLKYFGPKLRNEQDLSSEDIQKLKDLGLYDVLFPKLVPPKVLETMNLEPLIKICNNYLNDLSQNKYIDDDMKHYIYETVLNVLYGDNVWKFINAVQK